MPPPHVWGPPPHSCVTGRAAAQAPQNRVPGTDSPATASRCSRARPSGAFVSHTPAPPHGRNLLEGGSQAGSSPPEHAGTCRERTASRRGSGRPGPARALSLPRRGASPEPHLGETRRAGPGRGFSRGRISARELSGHSVVWSLPLLPAHPLAGVSLSPGVLLGSGLSVRPSDGGWDRRGCPCLVGLLSSSVGF